MLNRLRDPNNRVRYRLGYPKMISNGTWAVVLDDKKTGQFVCSRIGFKSYDDAVAWAADFFNVE